MSLRAKIFKISIVHTVVAWVLIIFVCLGVLFQARADFQSHALWKSHFSILPLKPNILSPDLGPRYKKPGNATFFGGRWATFHPQQISENQDGTAGWEAAFVTAERVEWGLGGCASQVASLTFLRSCSCSCCRRWTPGSPGGSSSSSSPRPGLFLCFSAPCSAASYLLPLHRQKTKGVTDWPSPPGGKKDQPTLRGPQRKRTALLFRKQREKVFQTTPCWVGWTFSKRRQAQNAIVSFPFKTVFKLVTKETKRFNLREIE